MLKIMIFGLLLALAVSVMLCLGAILLVKLEQCWISSSTNSNTDTNHNITLDTTTASTPPELNSSYTSSADFLDLDDDLDDEEEEDFGINMEGMNGYPGGSGDQQMFEDEEQFQDMDYGYIDKNDVK
jgi:hypothetical protein